ncbi:MAG: hypothetical protein ACPGOY_10995 [Rhodospirillaceae bacterium]
MRKCFHLHMMKTGGTTVTAAIIEGATGLPYEQVMERVGQEDEARLIASGGVLDVTHEGGTLILSPYSNGDLSEPFDFAFVHTRMDLLRGWDKTSAIVFTILRDPVERILSLWRYTQTAQKVAQQDPNAKMPNQFGMRERMSAFDPDPVQFFRNLPLHDALHQLYVFSPTFNVVEAMQNLRKCSAVLCTETLKEDLPQLLAHLEIGRVETALKNVSEERPPYTQAQRDDLAMLLAPEYRLYDYVHQCRDGIFLR